MRKTEYLDLLRYYLDRFPKSMVDDIIRDYEEHFAIGLENGKSEDEISNELGAPFYVAQEYISGDFDRIHREEQRASAVREPEGFTDEERDTYADQEPEDDDRDPIHTFADRVREEWTHGQKGRLLILAGIVLLVFWILPPLLQVVLTLLTLVVMIPLGIVLLPFFGGIGSILAGGSLLVQLIAGWAGGPFGISGLHPLTSVFFGFGLIGLGILLILLSTHAIRFVRDLVMKLVYRIRWEWRKRRES